MKIVRHPDADQEAAEAAIWYKERDQSAAIRFVAALDTVVSRIAMKPLQ